MTSSFPVVPVANVRVLALPAPAVSPEIADVVDRYVSALLSEQQRQSVLAAIKHLVLACKPRTVTDARMMLATASRLVADTTSADSVVVDLDVLLTDFVVGRWLHLLAMSDMAAGSVSNHQLRVKRFLRVMRGLPARVSAPPVKRAAPSGLDDLQRCVLEQGAAHAGVQVLAGYVAAVGAGLIRSDADGAVFERVGDRVWLVGDSFRRRVVDDLAALASNLIGVRVTSQGWDDLRDVATCCGVQMNRDVARVTFTTLALRCEASLVVLMNDFAVTYRMIDSVAAASLVVEPNDYRAVLRGGIRVAGVS